MGRLPCPFEQFLRITRRQLPRGPSLSGFIFLKSVPPLLASPSLSVSLAGRLARFSRPSTRPSTI